MIRVLKSCEREIADFPLEVREDLADALARLEMGQKLSMPLSRPMPSIGRSVHELRLRDRSGVFRVIYVLISYQKICLLHGFMKKTQETAGFTIKTARARLKEALNEE